MMRNNSTLFKKFFSKTSQTASRLLSAVALVIFSSSVLAQSPKIIKYSDTPDGKGTFTVPNCVTSITVQAWGAGGGGGYRLSGGAKGGYGNSGGGGGAYETATYNVSAGQILSYTIGQGGSGGPKVITNGNNIKDGKNTIFGSLIAQGGKGSNNETVENDTFPYGNGGVAPTTNGRSGGKGSKAGRITGESFDRGGGGGGAGHPGGVGAAGSVGVGGASSNGNLLGGKGGDGGNSTSNSGQPGVGFGGGGGGALKFLTGSPIGGDGAHGGIIITYTTVTPPSITSQPSTIGQNLCLGATATALSVSAKAGSGTIEKYEWYSNTTPSNTGGTLVQANEVSTSSNTYTPSTATAGIFYYYVVVTNTNKCTVVSNVSGPVTVNANNTVGAASSSPTLCINTAMTSITHATTGAIRIGTTTNNYGLPAGVTASFTNNTISISGTPTVPGDYTYTIPLTGGCGSAFATGKITVTPNMTAGPPSSTPTVCLGTPITPITHTTTGATGIGINNLPGGVTATWANGIVTISGTPNEAGEFNYSIELKGGCGFILAQGKITVGAGSPTTYNGTWSDGAPTINSKAIFAQNFTTSSTNTIEACSCQVNEGVTLTIAENSHATIQNDIINNGNIVVESDGNLVQKSATGTYTGLASSFIVKRNATNVKRLDYIYWSSPVSNQKMKPFSPGTVNSRFYIYNESSDLFSSVSNPATESFAPAKGYAIRADNGYPTWTTYPIPKSAYRDFEGVFKGTPHNGNINYSLEMQGFGYNLVGNPYSSNIDFFNLALNNSAAIEGKAYFWTNVNPTPETQQQSLYSGLNYSTLTTVGGTPATNGGPSQTPGRYIKVGQGFIVQAKSTVPLKFTNTMRNDGTGSSTFINKGNAEDTIDRFWLKLTTPEQNCNTILIAYAPGATNGYEGEADAQQFGESSDSFYSVLNDFRLNIQGRQFPLSNDDIVPLGMKGNVGGQYIIEMIKKDGIFESGQNVYLKDKQTGIVTNLLEGSYTFAANKGVSEGRFDIVYQSETVLATDATLKEELVVYRDGNDFIVKAQSKKITSIEVFDTTGKLVFKKLYNNTNVLVPSDRLSNGMYILKIRQGEQTTTKKILR